MYGRTLGSVLDSMAQRFPHEQALVDGDVRLSFLEVIGEIRAVGQALRALGLGPGDTVGIAMNDTVELALAMHGGLWAGITTVPLNIKLSVDNHAYMLADARVKALLYHEQTAEHVRQVAAKLDIEHVLTLGPRVADAPELHLSGLSREASAPQDVDSEAAAWIQYTGGTTGLPKGVVHSHRTLLSTLLGCALEFDIQPDERHAHVAPLTHGGLATFLPVWLRGGCNVLLRGFDVGRLLDAIEHERITSTLLVPTMVSILLDSPRLATVDVSSLRTIIYGAAPITPRTLERALDAFGPTLLQCYGQSEAFSQISILTKADHQAALTDKSLLTSAGRPVAIAEVRIGDDDGNPVGTDEVGEILVRGPHVFLEYLNKPEETAAAKRDGWLHTGDMGRCDADGRLHLVDRKKDMIISGGFNVYPKEIEDVLDRHPLIRAACVVGLPDEKWGERVTAVLVTDSDVDREELTADVISLVREKKGPVYAPKTVTFVDAIPLTSVGKYDKKALIATLGAP
jgi:fatty-acyl-CoA synthase